MLGRARALPTPTRVRWGAGVMTKVTGRWVAKAEAEIRAAQERGEFDNLPGMGKPLPGRNVPYDESWWITSFLRRQDVPADLLLPAPLLLRKKIEQPPTRYATCPPRSRCERTWPISMPRCWPGCVTPRVPGWSSARSTSTRRCAAGGGPPDHHQRRNTHPFCWPANDRRGSTGWRW